MKKNIRNTIKKVLVGLISLYQKTLSFDHGPLRALKPYGSCKYHPSCSEYCKQAIIKRGIIRGIISGLRRLGRCHPWSEGGYDPVK